MNARRLLAVAIAAGTAVTFAGSASASASLSSPRAARGGQPSQDRPHVQLRGFRETTRGALPRVQRPRATASASGLSSNWSGYVAVGRKNVSLRWISASWNVPTVSATNCVAGTSGYAYAVHWVGLDGYGSTPNGPSTTGEEIGVEAYCSPSGPVTYDAWSDTYPDPAVYYTGINPGDAVTASVYYDQGAHTYQLILTDITQNSRVDVTRATCPAGSVCRNASAEVITGATGTGPPADNLADFGMVSYTGITVTSRNGTKGTLAASKLWTSNEEILADSSGRYLAVPSNLFGGQAFNVTWQNPD